MPNISIAAALLRKALEKYVVPAMERDYDLLFKADAFQLNLRGKDISTLPFQDAFVGAVIETGIWLGVAATGSGKTIMSAKIAHGRLDRGQTVFLSPKTLALKSHIIPEFYRYFAQFYPAVTQAIGKFNDLSAANVVSFVTPYRLVEIAKSSPKLLGMILNNVSCIIIDEDHHFADEEGVSGTDLERTKIFGKITKICKKFAAQEGKLVVGLTGTFHRLDKLPILGKVSPDRVFSIQDAVNEGICPEIRGIQVLMDVVLDGAKPTGDVYRLKFREGDEKVYYDVVAGCMAKIYEKNKVSTAAFTATRKDAREICDRFNKLTGIGDNGLVVLLGDTPQEERQEIIRRIKGGTLLGFVTCHVGEESLDIPALEVIHLIRRTRSHVMNGQAIGRGCRVFEGKKRLLVVDYPIHTATGWVGLFLPDYAADVNSAVPAKEIDNGGYLVCRGQNIKYAQVVGSSMSDERSLVFKTRAEIAAGKYASFEPEEADALLESGIIAYNS